jgi:DNA modification methylase
MEGSRSVEQWVQPAVVAACVCAVTAAQMRAEVMVRRKMMPSNGSAKNRHSVRAPLSPAERALIEKISARPIMRVPIDRLRPSPGHARRHSKAKITALAASIRRSGVVEPFLVDPEFMFISGVARWLACQQLGIVDVPVILVDHLPPIEVRALRIAMGRFPEWAKWDLEQLRIELPAIAAELPNLAIAEIGFSAQEVDRLIAIPGKHGTDRADELAPASNTPPITRAGDLWKLGQNFLLCGDPLAIESYERILGSTAVRLVLTDPPYRAPIDRPFSVEVGKRAGSELGSGELAPGHLREFWRNVFRQIARVSIDGASGYFFVDWRHACLMQEAARDVFFELENHVVWVKDQSELGSFHRNQHEFVMVYKIADGKCVSNFARTHFGRTRSDVWRYAGANSVDVARGEALGRRFAPKPIAMLVETILNRSNPGDLVLDPFGGLGSTLIASERAHRRARLIEINPTCVDAIVRRWERFCGGQAILVESSQTFSDVADVRARGGAGADLDANYGAPSVVFSGEMGAVDE